MGVIGSAIGGTLGIGASIFGGISASKSMRKIKHQLQKQLQDNQNWYDRRYNEDGTQRADAQRMLTIANENIKQRNAQSAGTQAIMGGTDESVAADKAANNQAIADATSNIAVNAEARKDNIEQQYMENKANIQAQLNNLEQAKSQAMSQAVMGAAQAGSDMASVI